MTTLIEHFRSKDTIKKPKGCRWGCNRDGLEAKKNTDNQENTKKMSNFSDNENLTSVIEVLFFNFM